MDSTITTTPHSTEKIFIIGLPRTGTTSLCSTFLSLGYKVAHTAYIEKAFREAQVIADTPIFHCYPYLDANYPNAKFIYLERNLESWIPSIKQLLLRMYKNVVREDGGFNPMIKKCFSEIFSPFTLENIQSDNFLLKQYHQHQQVVYDYFQGREQDLLTLNLTDPKAMQNLLTFLNINSEITHFHHLNKQGKVTAWNDINHPLKVSSTHNGRIEKLTCLGLNT